MYRFFFKRLIDSLFALLVLIIVWPLMLIVCTCLFFANRDQGVFFMQARPGLEGKIFRIVKFKTMTDERDENGNLLPDSKRLTRIGSFIRSTSLDELPQLFNVLKGDMSMIGPRPLLIKYLPYYTSREHLRHSVRPGITGWAQVNGRNLLCWNERLEKDVWYVEHVSLKIDFKILCLTIKKILKREDIVVDAHSIMKNLDEERKSNGISM